MELQDCKVNRNINLKITKYIAFVLLTCMSTQAIAQNQQDAWLKRNWNNMIARFNIYFNAEQKLDAAVNDLSTKQKDDFNEVIPIYPYGTEADALGMRSSMEETMKKASKVIQNKPTSKWADDAYFIIGQTQFFSGDYYAAIETFQFVNSSYTDEAIKAMSQLWLMKAYIQQGKLDDAEAIYGLLKKIKSSDREFSTHLNLSAGDLMVKQNKTTEAIKLLDKGLQRLKDKTLRYRTHFVLGQLNLNSEKFEKANSHFIKVLRMNAPYEYVFQANLGMTKSTAQAGGQGSSKTIKYLKRMLNDDKNIDYYDQIYFELAKLEFNQGNEAVGLDYMRQSAKSATSNTDQQTKTYLYLADYYFGKRNYTAAQAYYDSTVSVISPKYPDSDKIKIKHSVLSKLIENIETIKTQDSLLALSTMDRAELDKQIEEQIEEEAEIERLAKEEAEIQREQDRMNLQNGGGNRRPIPQNNTGTWYFYNASTVSRGTNDFQRLWGNRKHGDFWRFINKSVMKDALDKEDKSEDEANPDTYLSSQDEDQNEAIKDVAAEKRKYYSNIPFSATAKLVANKKIQQAYLGTGKIYFDDLKEFAKAKTNFSMLLNRYPTTLYKPEALFYLSKSSSELGDSAAAATYAKQIADEFQETAYNSVLNSKEITEDNSDKEVLSLYETMYSAYKSENFDKVTSIKKKIDQNFAGNSIQGKVDYLFALTIGKTSGKEAYLKELDIVKEAYSGTEIGEMAAYTIRLLNESDKPTSKSIFSDEKAGLYYYVITGETKNGNEVEIQLGNYNQQFFGAKNLATKSLVFGRKQLIYVKQFESKKLAMAYHKEMKSNTDFLKNAGLSGVSNYAISEANFKLLVKTEKEKEYLQFFNQNYK